MDICRFIADGRPEFKVHDFTEIGLDYPYIL